MNANVFSHCFRLCIAVAILPSCLWAAGQPVITAVDWPADTPLQEGRTVLLRIRGQNLTPDLVPAFIYQHPSNLGPFIFSQWTANGTNAGVRFHIPVLPLITNGALLPGAFELAGPNGELASIALSLTGLDEFHLATNQTLVITNISQRLYSEIRVDAGATIRVEGAGALDWKSTGPVVIDGLIDAEGLDGTSASGGLGGAVFGRKAGSGGNGGLQAGNIPPQAGSDGDHPLAPRVVVVAGGTGYLEPASTGGLAGHNNSAAATDTCTNFSVSPCSLAVNALFDYGLLPGNHNFTKALLAGAQGWSAVGIETNFARPRAGYAGGGGGGGGTGTVPSAFDGGGGGQGGEGGRGVRLIGGSTLTINGLVTTDGGRGGKGWKGGGVAPLTNLPSLFDLSYSGGGGGGGAAGELLLASRGAFQRATGLTTISTKGGQAGQGGVYLYDASAIHGEPWVERGIDRVPSGRQSLFSAIGFQAGPVFVPAVWEDTVTTATFLEVLDTIKTNRLSPPYTFEIRGELPGQVRVATVAGVTNQIGDLTAPYRAMLVLFPGFNTIIARPTDGEEPMDHPDYSMLFRRIFTLGGTEFCDANCESLATNAYTENGIVRYIAGDGINHNFNYLVNGARALETGLRVGAPARIAYGPDGRLYFTQTGTNTPPWGPSIAVRRLEANGTLTTIVGAGTNFANDIHVSELALNQQLDALAVGPDGSIFLHERAFTPLAPQRIRKIGPDGFIHTVVGGGTDKILSPTPVPATSVDLDVYAGYDMAVDVAGNIYLSRRVSKITPIASPPFSRTDLVGVISLVTPDGMLQNIVGGNYLSGPGQGGGFSDAQWDGQPALAAGAFPEALAVSPDGQQIYFHTTAANSHRVVRADLDPFNSTPTEPRYILHNVTTNSSGTSGINDNVPARTASFIEAWDMSLALDGCLFIGGRSFVVGSGFPGTIHKITPSGISYLVYGGVGPNLEPTNSQPARFHGSYAVGYTDVRVGPDNRVVFFPRSTSEARLAKIVQPWDAPLPFAPPPTISFATATMVVWETNGLLQLSLRREGYAGLVITAVNKPVNPDIFGSPSVQVNFNTEETNKTAQFTVVNNFIMDGTRTVEFTVQFLPPGWTPPVTDPGLQEVIGLPDRLSLVILDDESPPPPARLLAPVLLGGGLVQIGAIGIPNRSYVLQNSFNLSTWADLQTNSSPIGVMNFQINLSFEKEFFRLRGL